MFFRIETRRLLAWNLTKFLYSKTQLLVCLFKTIDSLVFISFDIDVSERNIINSAIERDAKENLNRPPSARKNKHLQSVVDAINKCGVSFSVWQNRDVVRSVYHNKSNCHDACKETVEALKKIDNLQDFERTSHKYTKKNEDYWLNEIYQQRRKRPRLCVDTRETMKPH